MWYKYVCFLVKQQKKRRAKYVKASTTHLSAIIFLGNIFIFLYAVAICFFVCILLGAIAAEAKHSMQCWQMEVVNENKLIIFIEQKSRMIQFDAAIPAIAALQR